MSSSYVLTEGLIDGLRRSRVYMCVYVCVRARVAASSWTWSTCWTSNTCTLYPGQAALQVHRVHVRSCSESVPTSVRLSRVKTCPKAMVAGGAK